MRVIAKNTLVAFWIANPDSKAPLEHWLSITRHANWMTMDEVRQSFSKAKILNADRARFEIAGGRYRLIAAFNFQAKIAFIKFIGTHAEYDEVDAQTVSQF